MFDASPLKMASLSIKLYEVVTLSDAFVASLSIELIKFCPKSSTPSSVICPLLNLLIKAFKPTPISISCLEKKSLAFF